ncbi:hypothetical protein ACVMIH_007693 [Bradyrhizobium sp. USDA 4503]
MQWKESMELTCTAKLLLPYVEEDESSSTIAPSFALKGDFESLGSTSSERSLCTMNTPGERTGARLRYAFRIGAPGARFILARRRSLPFSIPTSSCRMSYCPRFKVLHKAGALPVAKLTRVTFPAAHLGRIWCRVGPTPSMAAGMDSWLCISSHLQRMIAAMA